MDAMPQSVVINIEDDISSTINIIDVDNYVSTEEKITNWHFKIRDRIKTWSSIECETALENLMEWYVETLNKDIFNIEVNRRFIQILEKHIQYFYSCIKELNWMSTDGYLDNMEQILALYLDCEGRIFIREKGKQKRYKKIIRKRLFTMLNIYLLNQEDRIHHALMKMRLNLTCDDAKTFLDNVFRVVFSKKPNNKSDAAFCRAFILYQKWKRIQSPEIWSTIDEMLRKMYCREPDSIQANSFWKRIIPTNTSLIGVIAQYVESDKMLCDAYFKYLKSLNIEESDVKMPLDILPNSKFHNLDFCVDNEQSKFLTLMESCAQLDKNQANYIVKTEIEIKDDDDDDDDCLIVSEDPVEIEILDDDDIINVADLKLKEPCSRIVNKSLFRRKKDEIVSFLDSINISKNNKDTSSGKNAISIDSVTSPLPKLQNLNSDSVKSREILSRKFTRKKEDIDKPVEYVVKPIKMVDYLKSNDVEESFQKFDDSNMDTETSNLHSPHSTFFLNDSATKTGSRESNASPTISSKCDSNVFPEEKEPQPMGVQIEWLLFNNLTEAESIDDNLTEAEAEANDDVEVKSAIDYTVTDPVVAEISTDCFEAESAYNHINLFSQIEAKTKCYQTEVICDQPEAELTSDLVQDEPKSFPIEVEPSYPVEAELTSYPVEAEPMSVLIQPVFVPEAEQVDYDFLAELTGASEVESESAIDQIEAESIQMEPLPLVSNTKKEYKSKNAVRCYSRDRVESTNNEGNYDIWKIKPIEAEEEQQGVAILRIKVSRVKSKWKSDVICSQNTKSNNELHLRHDSFKGGDSLDDCLVGEVEKIDLLKNVTLNGTPDIELFAEQAPTKESYIQSLFPQKNTTNPSTSTNLSDLKSLDNDGKKQNISFMKENNPRKTVQIQKTLNIPTDQMSEKSLTKYKVEPTHACLQGQLQVAVERCNEMEVNGWHNLSESTITQLEDLSTTPTPTPRSPPISQVNSNSMMLFRFNYDKSATWLAENDTVHYGRDEICWGPNQYKYDDISEEEHLSKTTRDSILLKERVPTFVDFVEGNREQDFTSVQKFVTSSCLCAEESNDLIVKTVIPVITEETRTNKSPEEIKEPEISNKEFGPSYIAEERPQTRLPLKKRKHSVTNEADDLIGLNIIEEIIKRARAEKNEKEDISYPAKPAISIAEIQEKQVNHNQERLKRQVRKNKSQQLSYFVTPIHDHASTDHSYGTVQ